MEEFGFCLPSYLQWLIKIPPEHKVDMLRGAYFIL